VVGLVFLAARLAYFTEDLAWAGWTGAFHVHALLLGAFNLLVGTWCLHGSVQNIRRRGTPPVERRHPAHIAAAILSWLLVVAVSVIVAGNLRVSQNGDARPGAVHWLAVGVFLLALLATPVVAIWGTGKNGSASGV
jgi:hypothetical protein